MARTKPTARVIQTRSSRTETRSRALKKKERNPTADLLGRARSPKAKSKTKPSRKKPAKKKPSKAKLYAVGKRVRVWWPPTRNKKRTDYSGAYWPAKVVDCFEGGYRVEYDNLEREDVDCEDVSPALPPVAFGEEKTPLAEREFCEVFNESDTDPSAWLAQIFKAEGDTYMINFPFHDSEPETVPAARVRRARVFDEISRTWKVIKPGQDWEDGEISSPNELELIDEATLPSAIASLDKHTEAEKQLTASDGGKCKDMESIMNGIQSQRAQAAATAAESGEQLFAKTPAAPRGGSVKEGRSRSKRSIQKDPNAPKKPRSAYVFFMESEQKNVKEKNPGMRPQHVMRLVGENWAKLPAAEKEEYEEMARADRTRYTEDMKSYTPPEVPVDEPGAKRARTEDRPRKPQTAFVLFSKELRPQLESELSSTEKTKKIIDTWRMMSNEEREKYQTAAKEDKERYDKELAEIEAEAAEDQLKLQHSMIKSFAEVAPIDFQPPPLTRTVAPLALLDDDSKKILEEFDVSKARTNILAHFTEKAYYLLLDVWREGSARVRDAIRAYKAHIASQEHPDWRAFFISIVGVESTDALVKGQPPSGPAATSDPAAPLPPPSAAD